MKPHVIVIMADQLRFDVLGKGFTPTIDALREESVVFSNTYCASPLCVPSRGAFYSGMYPNSSGSLINPWNPSDAHHGDVRASIDTLYTLMEGEWESIHSGKQHLYTEGGKLEHRPDSLTFWASTEHTYKQFLAAHGKRMPGGPAFKIRVPEMEGGAITRARLYSNAEVGVYEEGGQYFFDSYFTDCSIEALRSRRTDRPLLLNATYFAPHPPLDIPEPWFSRVKEGSFVLPENVGVFFNDQSPLQLYNLPGYVGSRYDRAHWAEAWRVYLGLVSLLDDMVARLIGELKAQDLYDESVIIFTSDHGEMLGSHALFQKMCMYEESVRIPLSFKMPASMGVSAKVVNEAVSNIDVLPTLGELLDLKARQTFDGRSLLDAIVTDAPLDAQRPIFIQFDGNGARGNFQRCVVRDGCKLIVDLFKDEVFYELYHLGSDPQERRNLLLEEGHDQDARTLFTLLDEHMRASGDLLSLRPFDAAAFRSAYGRRDA